MKQFIKYVRVSTKSQGDSGLGLEAQERDINIYLDNYAQEPYEVIAEFSDVASGAKSDRPQLTEAIELSKETNATILVSKLDFISTRTKAALAAAKARGVKLGGARPEAETRHKAVQKLADANAKRVMPIIVDSRKLGKSLREIAKVLNDLGVKTSKGGRWHQSTVHNYEKRISL